MNKTKKVIAVVLSIVMIMTMMPIALTGFALDFDETWTAITNAEELKAIENDYYGKYYLANDIALGDFDPIGWSDVDGDGNDDSFYGEFNGNGHTISGLTQDYGSSATYNGLFAKNFGTIENLTIDNAYIYAKDGIAVVAGVNRGTIKDVTVQNSTVIGQPYYTNDYTRAGIIAGQNGTGGTIENCTVKSCYLAGNIMVGGIAGSNLGTIKGCTADDIRINSKTKGNTSKIDSIYNAGAKLLINNGKYRYYCIGGLVGNNQGTLTQCEVVTDAIVYGFQSVGGLVGYNSGSVTKCWFGVPDSVKDIPFYSPYIYGNYSLYAEDTHWDIGENESGATAEDIYGVTADPDHQHVFTTWTVVQEATCTEKGLKVSVCDICGAKSYETIPALGHVDKDNDKKCDNCGADVDCHKHVDEDDNGYCDDCGENICEHASTTIVGAKDATCEEAGYTGNTVCAKCGKVLSTGTEIPALGHVDKDNDKKCDRCGADVDCHKHVDEDDNGY
ncbi:MAG: GLUG motif-containing protein, partial [Acutalibacteraceae bacterium]